MLYNHNFEKSILELIIRFTRLRFRLFKNKYERGGLANLAESIARHQRADK